MGLPKFTYHEPRTTTEALEIMGAYGAGAKPLAGGTDLLVNMKKKLIQPEHLVSLGRISEMREIRLEGEEYRIGALVTVARLLDSAALFQKLPALVEGARNLGTPLIRNLATIGGNLGSARPAADLPPPLSVYGAKVRIQKTGSERMISLDDFFAGPGFTEVGPDELLTEIVLEAPPDGSGAGYAPLGVRKAQDCNIVNVAAYLELDSQSGNIQTARITMGCVGPTPLRAQSAESLLQGRRPEESLFQAAGEAATKDCSPIDDFRGKANYKRDMTGVLTRRALAGAHKRATGAA